MAALVAKKMANGSTRWIAVIRVTGHPPRKRTFDRKTDASRWAARAEIQIRDGERLDPGEAQRRTLREVIERYLDGPVAEWERRASGREPGWERLAKRAATRRQQLAW